jgi:hypothetical protein
MKTFEAKYQQRMAFSKGELGLLKMGEYHYFDLLIDKPIMGQTWSDV